MQNDIACPICHITYTATVDHGISSSVLLHETSAGGLLQSSHLLTKASRIAQNLTAQERRLTSGWSRSCPRKSRSALGDHKFSRNCHAVEVSQHRLFSEASLNMHVKTTKWQISMVLTGVSTTGNYGIMIPHALLPM